MSDRRSPRIVARQVQKYPLDRLQKLFKGSLNLNRVAMKNGQSPIWDWTLSSIGAVGLMMTLYSLVSPKRQSQILKAINLWKTMAIYNGFRTHCPKGHPYLTTETRRKNGWRWCRECDRIKKEKRKPIK